MERIMVYIAQLIVCSGVFYLVYRLLLDGRARFGLCRAYLLTTLVASAVIPALDIPVYTPEVVYYEALPQDGLLSAGIPDVSGAGEKPSFWDVLFRTVYWLAAAASFAVMAVGIGRMIWLRRRGTTEKGDGYLLVRHPGIAAPYSFFNWIFVGNELGGRSLEVALAHERSHIRHRHSTERLVAETIKSILWFNPFVWMMRRSLVQVHEFQADRDVIREGYDMEQYRVLIFKQLFGCSPDMASGLNHSITKKRFIMMTKRNTGRGSLLRAAVVLPVAGGLMMLFSFTRQQTVYVERNAPETISAAVVSEMPDSAGTTPKKEVKKSLQFSAKPYPKTDSLKISSVVQFSVPEGQAAPLVVMNGRKFTTAQLSMISPNAIESISVLKDKTATAAYGEEGRNGVVVVTLKPEFEALIRNYLGGPEAVKKAGEESEPFIVTEVMPKFQGGDLVKFTAWMQQQVAYPAKARQEKIEGMVVASFVIAKDGSLGNIRIVKSPDASLSDEVVRILSSSPVWEPGSQRGAPVEVKLTVPLKFKLN